MPALQKADVIPFLNRIAALPSPEARVKALMGAVSKERLADATKRLIEQGELVRIFSRHDALTWGAQWRAHAQKMENLYELARIQADMSDALLSDALAELERLRAACNN